MNQIDAIGRAVLTAWFSMPAPERRLIGRFALVILALAATKSTLGAVVIFYVVDRLTEE